jgi:hypothetical protein
MKLRPLTVPLLGMAVVAAGSAYLATKSVAGRCFYGEGWCTARYRSGRVLFVALLAADLIAAGLLVARRQRDERNMLWAASVVAGAAVLTLIVLGFWVFSANDLTF